MALFYHHYILHQVVSTELVDVSIYSSSLRNFQNCFLSKVIGIVPIVKGKDSPLYKIIGIYNYWYINYWYILYNLYIKLNIEHYKL